MFLALAGGFFIASTTWEACLTWMGSPSHLLQGILLTQGSNPDLLYCRQSLYHLSHQGSSATVHGMAKGWTPLGNWKATMLFPVVMYGCESWTIKKAEHWRIDAFELWCWRRLLRVPWTTRRSSQSILKEISPEYSLGGLLPELKLQYFGYLMWSVESLENTLMLGKIEGRGKRGWQRVKWSNSITKSRITILSKFRETLEGRRAWHATVHGKTKNWTQQWNNKNFYMQFFLSMTLQYPVLPPFPQSYLGQLLSSPLPVLFIYSTFKFIFDRLLSVLDSLYILFYLKNFR